MRLTIMASVDQNILTSHLVETNQAAAVLGMYCSRKNISE